MGGKKKLGIKQMEKQQVKTDEDEKGKIRRKRKQRRRKNEKPLALYLQTLKTTKSLRNKKDERFNALCCCNKIRH